VELLLYHHGINCNLQTNKGYTALFYAIMSENISVITQILNTNDLDINIKDNNGGTVLTLAVSKENEQILKLILNHKDINLTIQLSVLLFIIVIC